LSRQSIPGAQPLTGLQLLRLDQGAAITTTPAKSSSRRRAGGDSTGVFTETMITAQQRVHQGA
jgi:hypothetical protein